MHERIAAPFIVHAFSAQKSHVKSPNPLNFQLQSRKQHKKNGLPNKNLPARRGILVMPHSLK